MQDTLQPCDQHKPHRQQQTTAKLEQQQQPEEDKGELPILLLAQVLEALPLQQRLAAGPQVCSNWQSAAVAATSALQFRLSHQPNRAKQQARQLADWLARHAGAVVNLSVQSAAAATGKTLTAFPVPWQQLGGELQELHLTNLKLLHHSTVGGTSTVAAAIATAAAAAAIPAPAAARFVRPADSSEQLEQHQRRQQQQRGTYPGSSNNIDSSECCRHSCDGIAFVAEDSNVCHTAGGSEGDNAPHGSNTGSAGEDTGSTAVLDRNTVTDSSRRVIDRAACNSGAAADSTSSTRDSDDGSSSSTSRVYGTNAATMSAATGAAAAETVPPNNTAQGTPATNASAATGSAHGSSRSGRSTPPAPAGGTTHGSTGTSTSGSITTCITADSNSASGSASTTSSCSINPFTALRSLRSLELINCSCSVFNELGLTVLTALSSSLACLQLDTPQFNYTLPYLSSHSSANSSSGDGGSFSRSSIVDAATAAALGSTLQQLTLLTALHLCSFYEPGDGWITDAALRPVSALKHLQQLSLEYQGRAGLLAVGVDTHQALQSAFPTTSGSLAQLPSSITFLLLHNMGVTCTMQQFPCLMQLTQLRWLSVGDDMMTSMTFQPAVLHQLRLLQCLCISASVISSSSGSGGYSMGPAEHEACASALLQLDQLTYLDLAGSWVEAACSPSFSAMQQLRELRLTHSAVNMPEDILANLPTTLTRLDVWAQMASVTAASAHSISTLAGLQSLRLRVNAFAGQLLQPLQQLSHLHVFADKLLPRRAAGVAALLSSLVGKTCLQHVAFTQPAGSGLASVTNPGLRSCVRYKVRGMPQLPLPFYTALTGSSQLTCLDLLGAHMPTGAGQRLFHSALPLLQVLRLGWGVRYEHVRYSDPPSTYSPPSGRPLGNGDVARLVSCCNPTRLQHLSLINAVAATTSMTALKQLSALTFLAVGGKAVQNDTLRCVLAQLSSLRELWVLWAPSVSCEGLVHLSSLKGLTSLYVSSGRYVNPVEIHIGSYVTTHLVPALLFEARSEVID